MVPMRVRLLFKTLCINFILYSRKKCIIFIVEHCVANEYGTVYPEHQVVIINEPFEIRCYSVISPQWGKSNQEFFISTSRDPSLIYVEKATFSHSGIYKCKGVDVENEDFVVYAQVYVAGKTTVVLSIIAGLVQSIVHQFLAKEITR